MSERQLASDVLIIGGGPAGLSAAIAARQRGFDVMVADRGKPPFDKACGEGLMPDAVTALERLGVTLAVEETQPFRGIRFIEGDTRAEAAFPQGVGLGVRRTILHRHLVQRAREIGVSLVWGARVDGASADRIITRGSAVRCRWVIGADGLNSRVRTWAMLDRSSRQQTRFGMRRHFRMKPWSDCVDVYWNSGCQLVITPVGPAEVCIVLLSTNPKMRLEEALAIFPELKARVEASEPSSLEMGGVSVQRSLKAVCRGRVALVGDASGSLDAIAGEGLCLSFQQVAWLAEALAKGDLDLYQRAHRRIIRKPAFVGRLLLMDRHASLRKVVLRTFAAKPRLFSKFVARHVGALVPAPKLEGAVTLDWELPAIQHELQGSNSPESSL